MFEPFSVGEGTGVEGGVSVQHRWICVAWSVVAVRSTSAGDKVRGPQALNRIMMRLNQLTPHNRNTFFIVISEAPRLTKKI